MIIGINGRIGSGKDTLGMILQALTMEHATRYKEHPLLYIENYKDNPNCKGGWTIKKFATKLKVIAGMLLGVEPVKFEDQEYKNSTLDKMWNTTGTRWAGVDRHDKSYYEDVVNTMTVREFLQKLGTDAMRMGLHDNVWVNALFADYKSDNPLHHPPHYYGEVLPNWIITDVRFPNEAQAIKDRGGIVVRIDRLFNPYPKSDHISETALNDWKFDGKYAVGEGHECTLMAAQEIMMRHEITGSTGHTR